MKINNGNYLKIFSITFKAPRFFVYVLYGTQGLFAKLNIRNFAPTSLKVICVSEMSVNIDEFSLLMNNDSDTI